MYTTDDAFDEQGNRYSLPTRASRPTTR